MQASLVLDGELSEIEEASLRAHTRYCAACASFRRELAALAKTLRAAPPVLPRATSAAVVAPAVVMNLPRRRRTTVRALQLSAAAAAVVLAAALGSLAGSLSSPGSTTVKTASTGPLHGAALIDRGFVAMAPEERLPASRIRPAIAL